MSNIRKLQIEPLGDDDQSNIVDSSVVYAKKHNVGLSGPEDTVIYDDSAVTNICADEDFANTKTADVLADDTNLYSLDSRDDDPNLSDKYYDQISQTKRIPSMSGEEDLADKNIEITGIRAPKINIGSERSDTRYAEEYTNYSAETNIFGPEGNLDSEVDIDNLNRQEYYSKENFSERYGLAPQTQTKKNNLLQTGQNILRTGLSDGNLDLESQMKTGARVYRLKGYTTIDKIKREFRRENREKKIRNILTILVIIIFVVIMLVIYNPIKDLSEWRKILGIDSVYAEQTITEGSSGETIGDIVGAALPTDIALPTFD